jgi:hypothetical protein
MAAKSDARSVGGADGRAHGPRRRVARRSQIDEQGAVEMPVAHVGGLPIEETALTLAPVAAVALAATGAWVRRAGRAVNTAFTSRRIDAERGTGS